MDAFKKLDFNMCEYVVLSRPGYKLKFPYQVLDCKPLNKSSIYIKSLKDKRFAKFIGTLNVIWINKRIPEIQKVVDDYDVTKPYSHWCFWVLMSEGCIDENV